MPNTQSSTVERVYDAFFNLIAIAFVLIVISYLFGLIPPNSWRLESGALLCLFLLAYSSIIKENVKTKNVKGLIWNVLILGSGVGACIYLLIEIPRLEWYYGSVWTNMDIVFGTLLIIALLDFSRKKFGWALPIIALIFLAYTLFGDLLSPQFFGHTGFSFERTISYLFGPGAIFGIVMSTFVNIIFIYMLFGVFLERTGVGKFLVDLSFAIAGRLRGGPAKVAVVASAILGSINGNSVANVATTGSITIPLMKKTGYKSSFAGGLEAAASTGGQLLPPIMGAGAFLMAEFLQLSYREVITAALLPAILYFVGVFLMVDLEAVKNNLKGIKDTPKIREVLKSSYLVLPIFVLVYALIIQNMSVTRSGFLAIAACIVISWFTKDHKMGIKGVSNAIIDGAKNSVGIGAMCAAAGIVIGTVSMTGLGNSFSSVIINLAGSNILIVAFFTALISIVLGMGLPTTAAYIISMSVAVPSLVALGIPALSAHLFVFYFAVVSAITPPVGAAFYTGAAIAKANVMATGMHSVRIGIGAFTVPFFFIISPVLLLDGTTFEIVKAAITAIIGIVAVTMAIQRLTFIGTKLFIWQSLLLIASFVMLIYPSLHSDVYGFVIFVLALLLNPKIFSNLFSQKKDLSKTIE
ncbi:TRAP transporter fused permease subunit [Alkalihalobacillus sp. BA299]|uniref:TRAP transporter permease n=1 Tax=Alkalihalobacillus sp. BA299 TaxID=2815938 RepID=UPI001ADA58B9|nr:TRAP transporter fused permease subunit [Alkalihalobacillus sp. BA299]